MTAPDALRIDRLGRGDHARIVSAAALFDQPPAERWAHAFLDEPGHHLLLASHGDLAVGFVSAVEMLHPDKGRELFLYELSVAPEWRRQGVARALLESLVTIARERDCYDVWVLTDDDNAAAVGAYTAAGAVRQGAHAMFEWQLADD